MTLPPHTVLADKWRIDAVLGEGGMGVVYAATHVRNGARVAVKLLHAEIARDASMRQRFLQEGYIANRVEHSGVVKVIDDGTTAAGEPFIVMERLEGGSLEQLAQDAGGTLPVDQVVHHVSLWLEVIAKAHAVGIVHRDLKPENVFVCTNGDVKVLDFGIAQVREVVNQKRLTTAGVPLGTPAYMPPEQALAHWEEVDARSDVYAIGASIFSLLTGQLVHDGRTIPEILVAVSTKPARPLRQVAPHLPIELALVVDRALAFRPEDRFAHAADMLEAWRAAIAVRRVTVGNPRLSGSEFDGANTVAVGPAEPFDPALARTTAGQPTGGRSTVPVTNSTQERAGRSGPVALVALFAVLGVAGAVGLYSLTTPSGTPGATGSATITAAPAITAAPVTSTAPPAAGSETSVPLVVPVASAASSVGSAAVSATAAPSASPARTATKPPPIKPSATAAPPPQTCRRDEFTGRCPCARCVD